MNGRLSINMGIVKVDLWFNNFSRLEIAKNLLPPKDGFDAKPQEIELLEAIEKIANDNHLVLMREIIWAGIVGYSYGKDKANKFTRQKVSELIAEADQSDLAAIWQSFLESIGMNLDKDENEPPKVSKKKVIS